MIQFFGYANCSTCRKAKRWFDEKGIHYEELDITVTPPSKKILTTILKAGDYPLKALFNRSGQLYRQMGMKTKINSLSQTQLIDLLAQNGKLVKRPVVTDGIHHTVGFDSQAFDAAWQ